MACKAVEYIGTIVVTAVVTLIVEHFIFSLKNYLKNYLLKNQQKIYSSRKTREYIERYYEQQGCYDELFECRIFNYSKKILFLSPTEWHNQSINIYQNSNIIENLDGKALSYKESWHVIQKRKVMGQKLNNDKALYLSYIKDSSHFVTKECRFFQKLSLIGLVEEETYRAAFYGVRSKLRDRLFPCFYTAIKNKPYPMSFGCDVALFINIGGTIKVALQKRALETSSYGGYMAVLPSFGFSPIPEGGDIKTIYKKRLYKNVFFYNILKEYCEEIFNIKELESWPNGHSDPYCFYEEVPEAKALIDVLEEGKAFCTYLGAGVDAINGMVNMAAMLYIQDEALSLEIYRKSISNWESNEIRFMEVNLFILRDYLKNDCYQNETAFTLSLALKELELYT